MKTVLIIFGILFITGCAGVGVSDTATEFECPTTIEEEVYVPLSIFEDEVEDMVYEWESNPDTYVEVDFYSYNTAELKVWESSCNIYTYIYYGI